LKKIIAGVLILISLLTLTCGATDEREFARPDLIPYIEDVSAEYGVSPELIEAMIETESRGISSASNGSCIGLMQVSTRWHRDRAARLGVDIRTDEGNIKTGVDFLMELAAEDEDLYYVLARYNGQKNAAPGKINGYATEILNRANELEIVHGKRKYESK
jgi:soluble lytic murein transglycosylase-like protein